MTLGALDAALDAMDDETLRGHIYGAQRKLEARATVIREAAVKAAAKAKRDAARATTPKKPRAFRKKLTPDELFHSEVMRWLPYFPVSKGGKPSSEAADVCISWLSEHSPEKLKTARQMFAATKSQPPIQDCVRLYLKSTK